MKKFLKVLISLIAILIILVPIRFYMMGQESQEMEVSSSLVNNSLLKCGKKPNCVSSFQLKKDGHYIAPLDMRATLLLKLDIAMSELNCTKTNGEINYWQFECKSMLFGFTDDIELLYRPAEGKLYFRSASRVGYSDLDANRKRINKLKAKLK